MRLLLVEDDESLRSRLLEALRGAGFAVDTTDNGLDGEHMGRVVAYDLIVLDLGLPGRSGLEVLQAWRRANIRIPVLILTARDAWYERVDGFKAGADDYLGKPFHVEELLARLNALIKRSKDTGDAPLQRAGLRLDEARQEAIGAKGERIPLTGTEYRLLRYFMLHPGQILSKDRLADHVYDLDGARYSNVIEVYVNRLRGKVGRDLITTRRGQGYVFVKQH